MDTVMIFLRLVHILGGIFWAGGAIITAGFILPTVRAIGPEGSRFMQRFAGPSRFAFFMSLAAPLTTLAGLVLYWKDSGFRIEWIVTRAGLGYTVGGLAGIAALVLGLAVMSPTTTRVEALGKEMQAGGRPPTPAQLAQMQALQEGLRASGIWGAILLIIAVVAMSVARYL
jgi:uncharacterized membrane protein